MDVRNDQVAGVLCGEGAAGMAQRALGKALRLRARCAHRMRVDARVARVLKVHALLKRWADHGLRIAGTCRASACEARLRFGNVRGAEFEQLHAYCARAPSRHGLARSGGAALERPSLQVKRRLRRSHRQT